MKKGKRYQEAEKLVDRKKLYTAKEALDTIVDLIQPLGNIYIIDESRMNAYIAANGSGIAFVYELMRVFTKQAI